MSDKTKTRIITGVLYTVMAIGLSALAIIVAQDQVNTRHCMEQSYTSYSECMED